MLRRRSFALRRALVLLIGALGLLMVVTACGGSDSDSGADADAKASATTEPPADPVPGGSLVYGVDAESDGWNPTTNSWGPAGILIALAVYDPLAAYDAEGVAQPYLAESFEHNADFTQWTIKLRDGVTFHNGDPLTADAVKVTLDGHLASGLTSPAFSPVQSVDVTDPLTVVVTMETPWVVFPTVLTWQTGVVAHPSIIQQRINDRPVGTGPFEFVEWVPDRTWSGKKYQNYWREGLPYLDTIEFRPLTDGQTRVESLKAGDLDVIHTSGQRDLALMEPDIDAGDLRLWTDTGENEEGSLMLNTAKPPFDDVRLRRALAYATDQETYNAVINEANTEIATGPFTPTNPFYAESGYPTFDLAKAQSLVDEVKADGGSASFVLGNTSSQFDRDQSALLKQMYEAAGFEVELEFIEQTQYILNALAGDYDALAWRQFSSPDPDGDYQWWISENAAPLGQSGLNFSRIKDEGIDAALNEGRQNPDPDARKQAYADLQKRMGEVVPFVWFDHVQWYIVANNSVHDVPNGPLPDGQPSLPFQGGVHRTAQIWMD